jgi:hypothetical protein
MWARAALAAIKWLGLPVFGFVVLCGGNETVSSGRCGYFSTTVSANVDTALRSTNVHRAY